ncbi:hypothetical protein A2X44_02760 [candidate division CPR3 bacterium GWF2_35_18]|uniref:Uncharacterized protein n=1 Tax=candidate division CPR3 bacterium GW2011_GWF2_35_18 TaxID=1618350 RepID=A0A0G0E2J5_UNCC3|nr:MAG: hypothetical protein UR67_C0006G0002 [candidate division CPR3 bacterium GW2011_GWF2_35_18]KKP86762.1 MAG: hypothetical protein UR87_C0011G0002 [candidate division CPR3 bacterium GW2011_GWE2_35_7]OGB62908.1 MAG: hypothetical protein A2X44_02760 [candidate division CPR3 bacterium GWF2_35_18]OGB65966.1 MAG: hypothetical protein A2250_03630 [candidate division CPR3 bacterium RIFOXYA2_FULL_35_13]OGB79176.1 MAG: hypothetical protein A2296_00935 [candidate division CPR3 bacterium RIFOXYB2_FULL
MKLIKTLFLLLISSSFYLLYPFLFTSNVLAESINKTINNIRINAIVPETGQETDIIDTDKDGIPNIWEIFYNLNPKNPYDAFLDTDQDKLNNLQEYNYNTNPRLFDTNEGGIDDYIQIVNKYCPYIDTNDFSEHPTDSDYDGIPDWWERLYSFNPYESNADLDLDGDGLTNINEYLYGTNPTHKDTDKDDLWDGIEVFITNTNPNNNDSDFDNLNDYLEIIQYNTNPNLIDTDDDEMTDGDEILNGTDPLDYSSKIQIPEILVLHEEISIPKKNNQYELLISHQLKVVAIVNNTQMNTKLNMDSAVYNNNDIITTSDVDAYIVSILTFYSASNEALGKTYLNLNIQEPLTVYKSKQYIKIFTINIYPNSIFYNNIGRILGLNKIYPLSEVAVEITPENIFKTNDKGQTSIISTEKEYSISLTKKSYSSIDIIDTGPVINPIVKLEKIYDLTLLIIIIIILAIVILINKIIVKYRSKSNPNTGFSIKKN